MQINKIPFYKLIISGLFIATLGRGYSQDFPGKKWMQYVDPSEAGFSSENLQLAKQQFESTAGESVLVIYKGKVLVSWGDNTRRLMLHSVRKSLMSALIGKHQEQIDLDATLEVLGIDDKQPLSKSEKQATVRNLITARSGVYHPSAYSPRGMEANLPERGSHKPGEFWYYNNWDFNVLLTIYEQQTNSSFFEDFESEIAQPLQMEDFRQLDTYYRNEPDKSEHPAYLFKMSARDLARFGLLYLNQGKWNGKQLVPKSWVKESTKVYTKDLRDFDGKGAYAYLWWVSDKLDTEMYYASGVGGQRIGVLPEEDLVIVHRTDTYVNKNVSEEDITALIKQILAAKVSRASRNPKLQEFNPLFEKPVTTKVAASELKKYQGDYFHRFLGKMTITVKNDHLFMENGVGYFNIYPLGDNRFYPEDIRTPVKFEPAPSEDLKQKIVPDFNRVREIESITFYY